MIIATNNKDKLKELKAVLSDYKLYSLQERNINIEVEEDEDTFVGNASKKAREVYNASHEEAIADDSGLCVNCLNGFPGVMTHRFLGEDATPRMRNEYIINEVNKHDDRSAQVVCDLVYFNGEEEIISEGILEGFISKECRGDNGFGFDEIFELPNGLTLAELSKEEKNKISARAIAVKELKKELKKKRY